MQNEKIIFDHFSKGWIPRSDVFPGSAPKGSCSDIMNMDIDAVAGGVCKSCGYDLDEYNTWLNDQLTKQFNSATGYIDLPAEFVIKHIENFSFGVPCVADLLLIIAYQSNPADGNYKYRWMLRDFLRHNLLESVAEPPLSAAQRIHDLLLKFVVPISGCNTSGDDSTVNFSTAEAPDEVSDAGVVRPEALQGFIAKCGDDYRIVKYNTSGSFIVTPPVSWSGSVTFFRNRIQTDSAAMSAIFSPSREYTSFSVDNVNSRLMIGLGKEVDPLFLAYISRNFFWNKTNSKYFLDYSGESAISAVQLEKRIPEFEAKCIIEDFSSSNGKIKNDLYQGYITGTIDGYQEVLGNLTIDRSGERVHSAMKININPIGAFNLTVGSYNKFAQRYLKFYEGDTLKLTMYFVSGYDWYNFRILMSGSTTEANTLYVVWADESIITPTSDNFTIAFDPNRHNSRNYANANLDNIKSALQQVEREKETIDREIYIGSFTWNDINTFIGLDDDGFLKIRILKKDTGSYGANPWYIESITNDDNKNYNPFSFECGAITVVTEKTDVKYFFYDGASSFSGVTASKFEHYFIGNSLKFTFKIDCAKFNRRLTALNIWLRIKDPSLDESLPAHWSLNPYKLVKTVYLTKKNTEDLNNSAGWEIDTSDNPAKYFKYITEVTSLPEPLDNIGNIRQDYLNRQDLINRIIYDPAVPVTAKYGVSTVHNNVSYIADTEAKEEAVRKSRSGGLGVNEMDIFSYDFENAIGFEMIGSDAPGYITGLKTNGKELVIFKSNSVFVMNIDAGGTPFVNELARYKGLKYKRSLVSGTYGNIFADDGGVHWYPGNLEKIIQINWQWDNYFKKEITAANKNTMFAVWNAKTEEYWLCMQSAPDRRSSDSSDPWIIFIADFKNLQGIDTSISVMKQKEKVIIPWRKKRLNFIPVDFATDNSGEVWIASANAVYKNNPSVFSMQGNYTHCFIEAPALFSVSPAISYRECFVATEKTTDEAWKLAIRFFADSHEVARERAIMLGNSSGPAGSKFVNNNVDVKPINIGFANEIRMRLVLDEPAEDFNSSTTPKKIRSFGVTYIGREPKYVTE